MFDSANNYLRQVPSLFRAMFCAMLLVVCVLDRSDAQTQLIRAVQTSDCGAEQYSHLRPNIRPLDEIWFVSTYRIGCGQLDPSRFDVVLATDQQDEVRSISGLIDTVNHSTAHRDVFFVHGNRTDTTWAVRRGWMIYRNVVAQCPDDRPIRLIVWVWPSGQRYGPLRDFRAKAELADRLGSSFGWVVQRIDPVKELSFIGYSYGARIVLGGLNRVARLGHLFDPSTRNDVSIEPESPLMYNAAEESVQNSSRRHQHVSIEDFDAAQSVTQISMRSDTTENRSFQDLVDSIMHVERRDEQHAAPSSTQDSNAPVEVRYRVALVAAAFDKTWLHACGRFADAYQLVHEMILVNNSRDRALKYYGLVERGRNPDALGNRGVTNANRLVDFGAKLLQIDVSNQVGTQHRIDRYFSVPSVQQLLHESLLD